MKRLLGLLLVATAAAFADTSGAIAIQNARIIPVSGPVIPNGTVLVRDGLIEAVGTNVSVPADAWVLDGKGLTVYPGLIDALSTFGIPDMAPATPPSGGTGRGANAPVITTTITAATTTPARGPEDRPSTTSWLHAADLLKSDDSRLESARGAGFTTAVTFPNRGIFAGQGAVIDLAGDKPGQMVVQDAVGQYVTLANNGFGGGFPGSLLGSIAYIRQIYIDASYYRTAKDRYASSPRGFQRPEYDRALEGVLASPRILLPAIRRIDVDRMLRLASGINQKAILYGLPEGYRSADILKKNNAAVLVSLKWPSKATDEDPEEHETLEVLEVRDKAPSTPAVLAKNGVRFALYSDGLNNRKDLNKAMHRALDAGLSREDAIRAMTLTPAEFYGVSDRLGSIEKGKIANLVVTKGDLFEDDTQVKYVFVDGNKFEPVADAPSTKGRRANAAGSGKTPDTDMPARTPSTNPTPEPNRPQPPEEQ